MRKCWSTERTDASTIRERAWACPIATTNFYASAWAILSLAANLKTNTSIPGFEQNRKRVEGQHARAYSFPLRSHGPRDDDGPTRLALDDKGRRKCRIVIRAQLERHGRSSAPG